MPLLPHLPSNHTPTFTQQEHHAQGHRDAPHSFPRPLMGLPSWSSLPTVWTAAMSPQLTFPPKHPPHFNLPFTVRQSQFSDGSPFAMPSSFSEILSSYQLDKIHISQTPQYHFSASTLLQQPSTVLTNPTRHPPNGGDLSQPPSHSKPSSQPLSPTGSSGADHPEGLPFTSALGDQIHSVPRARALPHNPPF